MQVNRDLQDQCPHHCFTTPLKATFHLLVNCLKSAEVFSPITKEKYCCSTVLKCLHQHIHTEVDKVSLNFSTLSFDKYNEKIKMECTLKFVSAPSSSIYWLQCTEAQGVNICKTNSKLAGKITETNSKHMVFGKKKKELILKGKEKELNLIIQSVFEIFKI